jgi:hypothetical protein
MPPARGTPVSLLAVAGHFIQGAARKRQHQTTMATVEILATIWQRYLRQEAGGDTIAGNLLFF